MNVFSREALTGSTLCISTSERTSSVILDVETFCSTTHSKFEKDIPGTIGPVLWEKATYCKDVQGIKDSSSSNEYGINERRKHTEVPLYFRTKIAIRSPEPANGDVPIFYRIFFGVSKGLEKWCNDTFVAAISVDVCISCVLSKNAYIWKNFMLKLVDKSFDDRVVFVQMGTWEKSGLRCWIKVTLVAKFYKLPSYGCCG